MTYIKSILLAFAMALSIVAGSTALENKGASEITLDGGNRGIVPFPHQRHQVTLKDCQLCHTLFPQEQGGIMRLKNEGKLDKKQVMNKHCIKCHKSEKKEGHKTGPTSCAKCHVKDKK